MFLTNTDSAPADGFTPMSALAGVSGRLRHVSFTMLTPPSVGGLKHLPGCPEVNNFASPYTHHQDVLPRHHRPTASEQTDQRMRCPTLGAIIHLKSRSLSLNSSC